MTIISDEFPWEDKPRPDYASPKAGAHWRSMCDEDDERAKGMLSFRFPCEKICEKGGDMCMCVTKCHRKNMGIFICWGMANSIYFSLCAGKWVRI